MFCINCGADNEEGYNFCLNCGASLTNIEIYNNKNDAENLEGVKDDYDSEINLNVKNNKQEAKNSDSNLETPDFESKSYDSNKYQTKKNKTKILLAVGLVLTAFFAFIILGGILYWTGFFEKGIFSPPEKLIYFVQETSNTSVVTEVYSIKPNGKDTMELFADPDGFNFYNQDGIWEQNSTFSPDKKIMAIYSRENEELTLTYLNGKNQFFIDLDLDENYYIPIGFTPDGKYYVFSLFNLYNTDNQDSSLIFVDMFGNQVAELQGYYYGIFFSNSSKMVGYKSEYDDDNLTSFYLIDTNNWSEEWVGEYETNYGGFLSRTSTDGKFFYIIDEDGINQISLNDGAQNQIYDAKGEAYPIPLENNKIIILDLNEKTFDLYVLDLKKNSKVRIDKYVDINSPNIFGVQEGYFGIELDAKEKNMLYTVSNADSDNELHLASLDNKTHYQIDRGGNLYLYRFSPDNKHIAYIKFASPNEGGTLFICDFEGNQKVRIDNDVWSFQFVDNGSYVIYSKVEDLSRERPVSELISVKINGKNSKSILQPYDGLITLLLNAK